MDYEAFARESNRIEGILRDPTSGEVEATKWLLRLDSIGVQDVVAFVAICQPNATLRDRVGLDVRVGKYIPPHGSPEIKERLGKLLADVSALRVTAHQGHIEYEKLHPFTDGNGRSGRAVWAWQMRKAGSDVPLGFLHHFYYQTLAAA